MVLATNSTRIDFEQLKAELDGTHLLNRNWMENWIVFELDQARRLDSTYQQIVLIQHLDHNDDNNEEQHCHNPACSHKVNNPIAARPLNQRIHLVGGNQKRI